ncbi:hypothetical protein LY78DRAFT_458249 [Colletotrichum sublineola]|nr:hypothetical protein LY78DRAFT_458249 [Colletotrichum sublineola]
MRRRPSCFDGRTDSCDEYGERHQTSRDKSRWADCRDLAYALANRPSVGGSSGLCSPSVNDLRAHTLAPATGSFWTGLAGRPARCKSPCLSLSLTLSGSQVKHRRQGAQRRRREPLPTRRIFSLSPRRSMVPASCASRAVGGENPLWCCKPPERGKGELG